MMKLVLNVILAIGLVQADSSNSTAGSSFVPDLALTGRGSYDSGVAACRAMDMVPLSIHNMETSEKAFNLCKSTRNSGCYIGLKRNTRSSGPTWIYEDGSTYDFMAWDRGQPQSLETRVVIYTEGSRNPQTNWHDWGYGSAAFATICATEFVSESPQPSNSPAVSPSHSETSSTSASPSSTRSPSLSSSNTAGVCNEYCVGEYGKCQHPKTQDFTCYSHDEFGNCPVNTVSCPTAVEADTITICQNCVLGTAGPCQHSDDGRCEPFNDSGVCAPNLIYCEAF